MKQLKASDLRGYNIVGVKGDAGNYQVMATDVLNKKVYLSIPRNNWHDESKIKSIPLTEEWLLRFGFYKDEESKDIRYLHEELDEEIEKHGNTFAFVLWNESSPAVTHYRMHSSTVHDFQNKFFAWTGEELKLTEG